MILKQIKLDALLFGFISIFIVLFINMLGMLFILGLLSNVIGSEYLYFILRVLGVVSLALPAYVAARTAIHHPILHSLIIGAIQALFIILLMTQTTGWETSMQSSTIQNMPLVATAMLLLSLLSGLLARWMNLKEQS